MFKYNFRIPMSAIVSKLCISISSTVVFYIFFMRGKHISFEKYTNSIIMILLLLILNLVIFTGYMRLSNVISNKKLKNISIGVMVYYILYALESIFTNVTYGYGRNISNSVIDIIGIINVILPLILVVFGIILIMSLKEEFIIFSKIIGGLYILMGLTPILNIIIYFLSPLLAGPILLILNYMFGISLLVMIPELILFFKLSKKYD